VPGFFSAITRFLPNPARNPYEESLAEIFAAVLRRSPGAACAVAENCGMSDLGDATVTGVETQRRAAGLERVDVELLFDSPTTGRRCLWLELKWGDDPRASQVAGYADHLKRIGRAEDRVVLIAPWTSLQRHAQELDQIVWRSWTDVALALRPVAVGGRPEGDVASWLVDEFLNYLKEQDLSAHEGLELEHLATLHGFPQAKERFLALVHRLDKHLEHMEFAKWGYPSKNKHHEQLDYFRLHIPAVTSPEKDELRVDGWLGIELHIRRAPSESDSRLPWALGAGFKVRSAAAPDRVLEACKSGLFESAPIESPTFVLYNAGPRDQWFVTRYLPLSGIVAEPELDSQVRRLAAFAEESWAVLSARPDLSQSL
jgi:hypothetical protein